MSYGQLKHWSFNTQSNAPTYHAPGTVGSNAVFNGVGTATFSAPGFDPTNAPSYDDVDGYAYTSDGWSTSGTVDVSNAGSYTLVYSVSDSGNNFVSVTRTVIVDPLPDTTPPTITLTGSSTVNLTVGDTFTDPGAIATDNIDGDITSSVLISGSVDTSSAGTYTISYNVSDAAGNAATVVRRTVIVSAAVSNSGNISFVNGTCQCPNATVGDTVLI